MPRKASTKTKTTKTKDTKTTKKTTKKVATKEIQVVPIKRPVEELTSSTTGISVDTQIISELNLSGTKILRLQAEQLEGKNLKIIADDQYFKQASCIANICSQMLDIALEKLSDGSTTHIKVAPNTELYNKENSSVKAQELLDGQIIKGVFSDFKIKEVHIFNNSYDRIINFISTETDKYMLENGVLVGCGKVE